MRGFARANCNGGNGCRDRINPAKPKFCLPRRLLDADGIESLRSDRHIPSIRMIDAREEEKRIFGVSLGGKKLYAGYQFDSDYFPLPIIGEILLAFPRWNDGWKVASWFAFANGWIAAPGLSGTRPLAPKDALSQPEQLLIAAANAGGTYVA